jgi:hypothetical protein
VTLFCIFVSLRSHLDHPREVKTFARCVTIGALFAATYPHDVIEAENALLRRKIIEPSTYEYM